MALYKERVERADGLIDRILELLTTPPSGAIEPFWKRVSLGTYADEGYVIHSKGSSGTDDIFIRIKQDLKRVIFTIMEKYTPNEIAGLAGTTENESKTSGAWFMDWDPYSNVPYPASWPIDILLSFDRDKIMCFVEGSTNYSSSAGWGYNSVSGRPGFVWAGMPKRLSNEKDSTCVAIAGSSYSMDQIGWSFNYETGPIWVDQIGWKYSGYNYLGPYSYIKCLQNVKDNKQPLYNLKTLNHFRTKGWANLLLLPDIYISGEEEGMRAIVDGIHPIYPKDQDFSHGDEIVINGKRYIILQVCKEQYYDSNMFPSNWLAIELIV